MTKKITISSKKLYGKDFCKNVIKKAEYCLHFCQPRSDPRLGQILEFLSPASRHDQRHKLTTESAKLESCDNNKIIDKLQNV